MLEEPRIEKILCNRPVIVYEEGAGGGGGGGETGHLGFLLARKGAEFF